MRLRIVKNKIDTILFETGMEEYKDVPEKPGEGGGTSEQPDFFIDCLINEYSFRIL